MFWWSVCDVSAIEIVQYCTLPSYSISYLLNERLHHTQQTTIARFLLNNKQIPTNTDSLKCRRGDKTSTLFLMQPFWPAGMIQMILRRDTYMSIYVYAVCTFCSMVCYPGLYSCLLCLHVAAFLVGDFWDVNCILSCNGNWMRQNEAMLQSTINMFFELLHPFSPLRHLFLNEATFICFHPKICQVKFVSSTYRFPHPAEFQNWRPCKVSVQCWKRIRCGGLQGSVGNQVVHHYEENMTEI